MTMNNLRDGLVWYASETAKDPQKLAEQLAGMPDAAVRRALVKIAAGNPDLLELLKKEATERDEFSCSEQPDRLRMPPPAWQVSSSGRPCRYEVVWWPVYDVQPVQTGDVLFFMNPGKDYNESNQYTPGCFPSDNQFALYEVELRFKHPPTGLTKVVFRLSVGDKIYMIVPLDNMYTKTTAPNTYAIGTVLPIHIPSREHFSTRVSFGYTDPSTPPNVLRCILNGYKLRDIQ